MPFGVREVRGLAAILMLGATALNAQKVTHWQCPIDTRHDGACSGDADCNQRYRAHLCDAHRYDHPELCSRGAAETPAPSFKRMSYAKAIAFGALTGSAVGAALGCASEVGKSEEEKQADKDAGKPSACIQGAILGAGTGAVLTVFAKSLRAGRMRGSGAMPEWIQRTEVSILPWHREFRVGVRW